MMILISSRYIYFRSKVLLGILQESHKADDECYIYCARSCLDSEIEKNTHQKNLINQLLIPSKLMISTCILFVRQSRLLLFFKISDISSHASYIHAFPVGCRIIQKINSRQERSFLFNLKNFVSVSYFLIFVSHGYQCVFLI